MDEIEQRMITAYLRASRSRPEDGEVSIHVGQKGWDWLRSKATREVSEARTQPWLARAWGFPVVLEKAWNESRVVVRRNEEIH